MRSPPPEEPVYVGWAEVGAPPIAMRFEAEVWKYPGESAWHFVTLPLACADEIREVSDEHRRGFGSVRVKATIHTSTWATSVFPEKASGSYVLPIKKAVRSAQALDDGATVSVVLEVVAPG